MSKNNKICCNIDNLPDHCLWNIFEQFSLEEIAKLRIVCKRWRCLIDHTFLKQTNLKLFASKSDLLRFKQRKIEFNLHENTVFNIEPNEVLILHAKNIHWSKVLCFHFPNIENLLIESTGNAVLQYDLIEAIGNWRKTLKYLTLIGWSEISTDKFWHVLNDLPSLESMIFFGLYRSQIPENMICFRRLKSFSLVHYLHDVVPVFRQLGPNVKFMLISWIYLSVPQLQQIVAENPSLATSLEFIRFGYISSITDHGADRLNNFRQVLQFFASNFINIRQLSIIFADNLPLIEIAQTFGNMKKLTHLSFYLSREELPNYNKINWLTVSPLKTITGLYIEIFSIDAEIFHFWIDPLFPNLKELTVKTNIDKNDPKFRLLEKQFLSCFTKLNYFLLKN